MTRLALLLALTLSVPASLPADSPERPANKPPARPEFEPTSHYTVRNLEGWIIRIHRRLLDDEKELGDRAIELLRVKLYEINRVVPSGPLAKLHAIPIWLEFKNRDVKGACYHPSKEWLAEHGFNPEKAGAIEIGHAANFLAWSRVQPAMVLHELAHAYHHQVLGWDHPEIEAAYRRAKESKSYDSVLYYDGRMQRAYAMNDAKEYFAELTESWFGTNDFYPFVRPEVRKHDPEMAKLLKKLWGE